MNEPPFKIEKRPPGHFDLVLVYAGIGLVGIMVILLLPQLLALVPPCLFYEITGIPCFSCGMTRSAISLSHLDLVKAIKFNPLFALSVIAFSFLIVQTIYLYFTGRRYLKWQLQPGHWAILRWVIVAVVLINWVYLLLFLPPP